MDVYSDVFAALRLEAGLYFTARLKGDFAVSLDAERRRIRFHHVLEGSCFVTVPGQEQVCLSPGDLALIPDGAPQTLSSSPGVNAALPLGDVLARSPPVEGVLSLGEAGPLCRLLCGFLRFDEALDHPVLASLPPLVVLRSSDGPGSSVISAALALLSAEAGGSGPPQASIVQRVVEILLMQTVRAGFAAAPPSAGGFSLALTDPRLAKALAAIHARPEAEWEVGGLAAVAGMSRSRFARLFTVTVGLAPMAYLTQWRMIKARELLTRPGLDMAEIAARCGYVSVPAFSRRFVATFGIGPGEWRKTERSAVKSPARPQPFPIP